MYAKVFAQIFDSSIADDVQLRHFFMDLLVLADADGCVDMTPTAIAARTRIPLEDVKSMLSRLEMADPESRTPDHEGKRIVRIDEHRTWGWCIINYSKFRLTANDEQRREKTRLRTAKYRERLRSNGNVTQCDASDAKQKQKQKHKELSKEDGASAAFDKRFIPTREEFENALGREECGNLINHRPGLYDEWVAAGWKFDGKPIFNWKTAQVGLWNHIHKNSI